MLKRTFRINALSLAGGALLVGGTSMGAGAMTLPGSLPGVVTEQSTAAIFRDGTDAAKVEQIRWHAHGGGWHGHGGWHGGRWHGHGWHGGGWHGGGWHGHGWHGGGWHAHGYGWHGGRWCYWHPYACHGY
ncbi:MAG TPA: hypothetical protein VHT02_00185 [Methylocella sp.]|nr:hypothetical protein [Methylocella sp.]